MDGNSFAVNPDNYTKPIRLYFDVDGVVSPFFLTDSMRAAHKPAETVRIERTMGYNHEEQDYRFEWLDFVAEKIAEWSKLDSVDFVWLTTWDKNAPKVLDPLLGIESIGYLPWIKKMGDHSHSFKKRAVEDDQGAYPSKFVWVDDLATQTYGDEGLFEDEDFEEFKKSKFYIPEPGDDLPKITADQYLAITPNKYVGLTHEHIASIEAFIAKWS